MKWIGALLLIGTTTWIGFEWSQKLNNRPKHIRQLKNALQILEAEILYSQLPLQEACITIAKQIPQPIKSFFQARGTGMEEKNPDLFSLWKKQVDLLIAESCVRDNEQKILMQFARTLGQHTFEQKQKHILYEVRDLNHEIKKPRDNPMRNRKMIQS